MRETDSPFWNISFETSKITKDDDYKLENSKTYFELDSKLKVDPLLITLPLYSEYTDLYDSSSTDWCTYNIKTIRGY